MLENDHIDPGALLKVVRRRAPRYIGVALRFPAGDPPVPTDSSTLPTHVARRREWQHRPLSRTNPHSKECACAATGAAVLVPAGIGFPGVVLRAGTGCAAVGACNTGNYEGIH